MRFRLMRKPVVLPCILVLLPNSVSCGFLKWLHKGLIRNGNIEFDVALGLGEKRVRVSLTHRERDLHASDLAIIRKIGLS